MVAAALAAVSSAHAQEALAPSQSLSIDIFASSDADDTEVLRTGMNFDWSHTNPDRRRGLRLETVTFKPLGQDATRHRRAYYRFADQDSEWTWNGQAGTDGHAALGAFAIHNESRFRQEYFLEREIVETPTGVERGIYYTLAGGALDLPVNERASFTVLGAAQAFTGRNVRLHVRANYVHVLRDDWGLSAQVRTRYFHSSHPREFDYFSPRNFVQAIPTLQLRRRAAGWRYVVAGGLGAQRQTGAGWSQARALSAQITSPPVGDGWALEGAFSYSNTPVDAGGAYDYRQFTLGLHRTF
jgi:hypothetical protein